MAASGTELIERLVFMKKKKILSSLPLSSSLSSLLHPSSLKFVMQVKEENNRVFFSCLFVCFIFSYSLCVFVEL